MEVLGHDAYHVKMVGLGRITKRNRRFLRQILPYTRVLAGGHKDDVKSKDDVNTVVLGTGSTVDDSNPMSLGVPAVGPVDAGSSASVGLDGAGGAAARVDGAGGTSVRGTGRPSVLRVTPSCV